MKDSRFSSLIPQPSALQRTALVGISAFWGYGGSQNAFGLAYGPANSKLIGILQGVWRCK